MNSKSILIVFPHNFFERKSGVQKRYYELVLYLKEKGFSIDLLGLRHFESSWKNFNSENSGQIIDQLYLYNFRVGYHIQLFWSLVTNFLIQLSGKSKPHKPLPDYAFPGMKSMFQTIMKRKQYDFIIVGYVYWANILKGNIPLEITTVLTMEDFISQKLCETKPGKFDMDTLISEEIERVNMFSKVICLSHEELQFFSVSTSVPEYFFVPVFMKQPRLVQRAKEFDILFIGFDNQDNIEGLTWFFNHVHPSLRPELKILVIGKINRYTPDISGVTKIEFLPDVAEAYSKSKISINPLQKGTGMKVKVVESLSYGIPIVNTRPGLCGFPPELFDRFILADNAQVFADEINRLLTDKKWYDEQCSEAKRIFGEYFDVNVAKKVMDHIF